MASRLPLRTALGAALLALLGACGGGADEARVPGEARDTAQAAATAAPPVADAGPAQNVVAGTVATLDGTASHAADGAALASFAWELASRPEGSLAALSDPASPRPTFFADQPGRYVARLIVRAGQRASAAATVAVTAALGNVAPVAHAVAPQQVRTGATLTLDGRASRDANGDALAYRWTLAGKPAPSRAQLSGAATAQPRLVADQPGSYAVQLSVSDGKLWSTPATVSITAGAGNVAPVADAGAAQTLMVNQPVTLDGSASADADGDRLTHAWTLLSRPAGSTAVLAGAAQARASFTPDRAGVYVARLVVSDGRLRSAPATVAVTVTAPLSSVAPGTWAVIGASTALGYGARAGQGWVERLKQRFAGDGVTVANLALAGTTSYQGLGQATVPPAGRPAPRAGSNVDAALKRSPSLLLVSYPSNDAALGYTAEETVRNLLAIRQAALAQGVPVVVLGTQPRVLSAAGQAALVRTDALLAAALGPCFVPVRGLLSGADGLFDARYSADNDGHPNDAGHALIQAQVRAVLESGRCVRVPAPPRANVAPVAQAGSAQAVAEGGQVRLDGTASADANGDRLRFAWTLSAAPAGSRAALSDPASATPSFVADRPGTYVASLVVGDGQLDSAAATVTVTAQPVVRTPLVVPGRWVLIGSSTAAGTGASAGHAWARLLEQHYASAGAALANLAVGGKTSYAALPAAAAPTPNRPAPEPALNVDAALAKSPSLLLVSFPTNDTAAGYTAEETVRNLLAIRQAALDRGVPVIVLSTQPRKLTPAQLDVLEQIDARLAAATAPCFVPLRALLAGPDRRLAPAYDAGDGIHPNDAGHARIEAEVKALLDAGRCVRVQAP